MYRTAEILFLLIMIGTVVKLPAQIDTVNIPLITISDNLSHKIKNNPSLFDTLQLRINSGKNLANLINNSAIQIKSYGPGLVNTVVIRGSSGSQTAVYWNDFQVNNLMLGNSDLSLFTSGENKKIDVDTSGNSYGAIGGTLKIKNEVPAIKETSLELSAGDIK